MSLTPLIKIHSRPQIFEKIWNGPNGILRGPWDTDLWKKLKAKISCQTPFNYKRDRRPSTAACSVLSLLCDGDKDIEIVNGEEKKFCSAAKAEQKSLTSMTSSKNQPRKDPSHLYSLSPHPPHFQLSSQQGPPLSCLSASTLNTFTKKSLVGDVSAGSWFFQEWRVMNVLYVLVSALQIK